MRDAWETDLSAVTALYGREVDGGTATFETTPPGPEEMARRLAAVKAQGLPWLVAEIGGQFAGYAYASPFRPRPAYRFGVEVSVYVEEGFRRRGVGRALLETLVRRVRSRGLRHLISAVSESESSAASIALHEELGFVRIGAYRQVGWKFGRWLDVSLMQLDLQPDGQPPSSPGLDL